MAEAHDGTGAGLDLFLDWAGRTGEMNPATANALRSTAGKVLSACEEGDGVDVTRLDVEATIARWSTLNRTNYNSTSLLTYKSRFRSAVAMYKAWLINEPGWKTAGKTGRAASASNGSKAGGAADRPRKVVIRKNTSKPSDVPAVDDPPPPAAGTRMVAYDLPLRPDLLVRLTLPADLTEDDAKRIAGFVHSLAFTANTAANRPQLDIKPGGRLMCP